jgi:hypothetical protein
MSAYPLAIRLLCSAFAVALFSLTALGQTGEYRPRKIVTAMDPMGASRLENEPDLLPLIQAPVKPSPVAKTVSEFASPSMARFNSMLLGAIDDRIGSPYVYGATGPFAFDCSGFVWSAFRAAGIPFERASARSMWTEFAPAREDEKYKFGTLVFFNRLGHVGIVADDKGFYHASRSHGVTYSPFNDYWMDRIDGFRRIPIDTIVAAAE